MNDLTSLSQRHVMRESCLGSRLRINWKQLSCSFIHLSIDDNGGGEILNGTIELSETRAAFVKSD